jgi:hypothetical protein
MPEATDRLSSKLPTSHNKRLSWALKEHAHQLVEAVQQDSSSEARQVEQVPEIQRPERVARVILERADPSVAKSMTGWLIQQYAQGKLRLEDLGTANETLTMFRRYAQRLEKNQRDLGQYQSLAAVWEAVIGFANDEEQRLSGKAQKALDRDKAYAESRILRQDEDGFTVAVPLTEFAAKWWGRGTRWCTSAKNDNRFWQYHKDAPLLMIIIPEMKERGKFQLWVTSGEFQFMGAMDTPVSQDVITEHWSRFERLMYWAASENIEALKYIPEANRTYEMWEQWVAKDGLRLRLVPAAFQTSNMCRTALMQHGHALYYVPKELITPEFCEIAVRKDGMALREVPAELRNTMLCKAAVKQDGRALEFVPHSFLTREICEIAIRQSALGWRHVPFYFKTLRFYETAVTHGSEAGEILESFPYTSNNRWKRKIFNIAVSRNAKELRHIREGFRSVKLYEMALRGDGLALAFVPLEDRTKALCKMAVSQNGEALQHVPESSRTKEICEIAVQNSGTALPYVPNGLRTSEMCEWAIKQDPTLLSFAPWVFRTKALCELAVSKNGLALNDVPLEHRTSDLCEVAIRRQGLALAYVPKHLCTKALCEAAVRQDVRALCFVPEGLRAALENQVQLSLNTWRPSILDRIERLLDATSPQDLASSIGP